MTYQHFAATSQQDTSQGPISTVLYVYLVVFCDRFLSREGAEILLAILNALFVKFVSASCQLPTTMKTLRNRAGLEEFMHEGKAYVTCSECHCIYPDDDTSALLCTHVEYANHRNGSYRMPCGNPLYYNVRGRLVPPKVYAYHPIISSLKSIMARPGYDRLVEHWKARRRTPGIMHDVYDGAMWNELEIKIMDKDGHCIRRKFVDLKYALMLTMNVDWFQAFDQKQPYSDGVIYFTINNLPRSIRHKKENVILAGVIPGPREPQGAQMNHYLAPIVKELQKLYYRGEDMTLASGEKVNVRAALFMVACDIPAGRKVCGFAGVGAKKGCHKCDNIWPARTDLPTQRDWSNFDTDTWRPRNYDQQRRHALQWEYLDTLTARKDCLSMLGVRFSELWKLKYFNPIRCNIVDPMHNLFSGTASRMAHFSTNTIPRGFR